MLKVQCVKNQLNVTCSHMTDYTTTFTILRILEFTINVM